MDQLLNSYSFYMYYNVRFWC